MLIPFLGGSLSILSMAGRLLCLQVLMILFCSTGLYLEKVVWEE